MNVIEKLFGTHSERELKMIRPIVAKIEGLRSEMMAKSDEELRDQTRIFKERLAKGETLDDLLPEAFATVREAARRTLNMEHFPVQLIGGIVLHQGTGLQQCGGRNRHSGRQPTFGNNYNIHWA